jgi:hypothetical protein
MSLILRISHFSQPTSFDPDDVKGCFAVNCKQTPEFRLISLEGPGTEGDGEGGTESCEAGVGIALFCREHAFQQARERIDECEGIVPCDIPTLGFLFLPMHIESELAAKLQAEVTPEVWTKPINQTPS